MEVQMIKGDNGQFFNKSEKTQKATEIFGHTRIAASEYYDPSSNEKWMILAVPPPIDKETLKKYEVHFKEYFGNPIKSYNEPVVVNETVPENYVHHLNIMNGFLFGGIIIQKNMTSVDGLITALVELLGGSDSPPINLFNPQCFYGKKSNNQNITEIVRICPHNTEELYSIEYMFHIKDHNIN